MRGRSPGCSAGREIRKNSPAAKCHDVPRVLISCCISGPGGAIALHPQEHWYVPRCRHRPLGVTVAIKSVSASQSSRCESVSAPDRMASFGCRETGLSTLRWMYLGQLEYNPPATLRRRIGQSRVHPHPPASGGSIASMQREDWSAGFRSRIPASGVPRRERLWPGGDKTRRSLRIKPGPPGKSVVAANQLRWAENSSAAAKSPRGSAARGAPSLTRRAAGLISPCETRCAAMASGIAGGALPCGP
jgi:hypothetical protein